MLGRRRFHVQGRAWPLAPLNEPAVEILTAFEAKREDLELYMEATRAAIDWTRRHRQVNISGFGDNLL